MHFTGKLEIPYDIFISIIDELASQGSHTDLRALSQTCRSLLHPCRIHLFSTISVNGRTHRFATLLKQNPTIKDYVRNLTYDAYKPNEDLANALLLLGNIQTLTLLNVKEWESAAPHIQRAIIHLVSSPSLTRISAIALGTLPINLLSGCSNLKHLKLYRCSNSCSDASAKAYDSSIILKAPPKLLSLSVNVDTMTATNLLNARRSDGLLMLDLSGLQSLNIRMASWQSYGPYLEQILHLTPDIEHLSFSVVRHDGLLQHLSFAPPPNIRSLKVQMKLILPTKFLELWSSQPNCIDEISITIYGAWSQTSVDRGWQELDSLLADRSRFPKLVKLTIRTTTGFGCYYELLSESKQAETRATAIKFKSTTLSRLSLAARDYLDFELCIDIQ